MALRTPLVYKFRRLDKLRGFRYPMDQFFQALADFPEAQHKSMRQANLIDTLVRKVFSLNLVELREHVHRLEANGGFLRADDFVYVMNYLKKLTAHYAYYKEAPFKTKQQSLSYVVLVAFFAEEFTQKFHHDPAAQAQAADFVAKSFPFWIEHMVKFKDAELLFVAKAVAQLSRKVELPQKSDFTAKLIPRIEGMMEHSHPAALRALLDIDIALHVLTPNQKEKIWERLGDQGQPAERTNASAIKSPRSVVDGH